jgi:hypothetical protein
MLGSLTPMVKRVAVGVCMVLACTPVSGNARSAGEVAHLPDAQYRVTASYSEEIRLSPEVAPIKQDVTFDVTYSQRTRVLRQEQRREVEVLPVAGTMQRSTAPQFPSRATDRPGVKLIYSEEGTLASIVGFAAADSGKGAGLTPHNFAPLYNLLLGTSLPRLAKLSPGDRWTSDHAVMFEQLGGFHVGVSAKVTGTTRSHGQDALVLEVTVTLPSGLIAAAILKRTMPGMAGEGPETIRARVVGARATGQLLEANGEFSADQSTRLPSDPHVAKWKASGRFAVELLPGRHVHESEHQ